MIHLALEYSLHIANTLMLASYLVREMLWLRLIAVFANTIYLLYYWIEAPKLSHTMYWPVVFIAVNLVWIGILVYERKPKKFKDAEEMIYQKVFHELFPQQFARLMRRAEWKTAKEGEVLIEKGVAPTGLMLIYSGEASVELDQKWVVQLRSGQFIGEMNYLTGKPPSANVIACKDLKYVFWSRQKIDQLFHRYPLIRTKVRQTLGFDLVNKLRSPHLSADEVRATIDDSETSEKS